VGRTREFRTFVRFSQLYPRSRGPYDSLWGKVTNWLRFIPARVGRTLGTAVPISLVYFHPHTYGGNA